MTTLPYVSSEGGPLLVADAPALRNWGGSFGAGADYNRACEAVAGGHLASLDGRILVWDIDGPGTAFLTGYDSRSFQMVRFWADDDPDEDSIRELSRLAKPTGERSSVRITTSPVIIVWACEEARAMSLDPGSIPGIPRGDWSVGGTVYCFPLTPGLYAAEVGRFESTHRSAISLRCTLSQPGEPGAAPNGGPAERPGNSGVSGEPPSVSRDVRL